ncbi:hypothetical protein [Rathayibacter sp. Leaf296]|uniref:hypothetical protein n=1 Tax=Rathayibacter sp. Leaf296 TaxID=1736327 RepID=UPI000703710B|nr:hypothetical protein [Rathayibacter sp. Leaf296]KQQ08038.1 hypothetical protein ASF46_11785 [Rathayibacter sp. Leaf296]
MRSGTELLAPRAHRAVSKIGEEALDWFRDRGLQSTTPHLRLFTDEYGSAGFRLARIWHSPIDATRRQTVADPPRALHLQIEGRSHVTFDGSPQEQIVEPGDALIVPRSGPFALRCASAVARYEVEFDDLVLPASAARAVEDGAVLRSADSALRGVVIATANAALDASMQTDGAALAAVRLALTDLSRGFLLESLGLHVPGLSAWEAVTYRDALSLIEQGAPDPQFTSTELARRLRLSPRYVQRIFAAAGTSPSLALRAERVALARRHLDSYGARGAFTLDDVARLSGFRTGKAMQRALSIAS